MEILQGEEKHLLGIMYLIREVVKDMNRGGMYHWNLGYPDIKIVEQDIAAKNLFIAIDTGIICGIMTLNNNEMPEYNTLHWDTKSVKPLFVHRIGILPMWQNKGTGNALISFIEKYAKENGYLSIRLDISELNTVGVELYQKSGFNSVGMFLSPFQTRQFIGFEKKI